MPETSVNPEPSVRMTIRRANGRIYELGEVGTPEFDRAHALFIKEQPPLWKFRHPIVTLKARRSR